MNAYKIQSNTLSITVVHPFPSMDVLGLRRTVCYDDLDTYQKNVASDWVAQAPDKPLRN